MKWLDNAIQESIWMTFSMVISKPVSMAYNRVFNAEILGNLFSWMVSGFVPLFLSWNLEKNPLNLLCKNHAVFTFWNLWLLLWLLAFSVQRYQHSLKFHCKIDSSKAFVLFICNCYLFNLLVQPGIAFCSCCR